MGKVAETLGSGLITGPATIVSGIMQSRASNKATDAQSKSAAETLAFAREQEAQRKAVYEQKMAQYTAMRNTLAQRYGIDIGTPPAAPGGPAMPGAVPRPQPVPAMAQGAPQGLQGATLGGLMQRKQEAPGLDSWNQPNYGLPTA
jgi:hypothetical protein